MSQFTYHRTKFLVIFTAILFVGLGFIKFGFSSPPNLDSSKGRSVEVINNFFSEQGNTKPALYILSLKTEPLKEAEIGTMKTLPLHTQLRK